MIFTRKNNKVRIIIIPVNCFKKLKLLIKKIEDSKIKDATIQPLVADINIIIKEVTIIKFR